MRRQATDTDTVNRPDSVTDAAPFAVAAIQLAASVAVESDPDSATAADSAEEMAEPVA